MLAALCDIVIPAAPPHPSGGMLKVHEFLDEWLSAPYPQMQSDRFIILEGLAKLDEAALGEFGRPFAQMDLPGQAAVFDRLCNFKDSSAFARRLIELICDGYYPTREGHAAIAYVGNVPLERFPGASADIVRHLEQQIQALPGIPQMASSMSQVPEAN
ncbi:gluconate 2-dehydrogenase subunit 3 family protein [Peristeroidobacter soli]|uniref:gluconate 2-dehydrogenase subunit 3 family protein n=1 Tax=Peristeroidobacter soli TaxID=2497877 RepID=UPI0013001D81|nr:gluconate 2-dehydrogenase subunit 3 family protein [Peristeroidobacter soli]